jgi:hypothetical protein
MTLPALLRSELDGMNRIQWTISPEYANLPKLQEMLSQQMLKTLFPN